MRATVLVVEDDELTRQAMGLTLEVEGFEVVECADGAEAVARARGRMPDVVIASAVLPDMSALDVAEALRALPGGGAIPVVACSGFAAATRPLSGGPLAEVLIKPVPPARLVTAVRDQLTRRPGRGQHILVADDDPALLKLARVRLERQGFRVTTAADVATALAAAAANAPDAVLSDVLMPDADGFELCLRLHQLPGLERVPVVLVSSAYTGTEDAKLATRVGAVALCQRGPDLGEALAALVGGLDGASAPAPDPDAAGVAHTRRDRAACVLRRQAILTAELERRCALQRALLSAVATFSETLARVVEDEAVPGAALRAVLVHSGATRGALYLRDGSGVGDQGASPLGGQSPPSLPALAACAGVGEAGRRALADLVAGGALRRVLDDREIVPLTLAAAGIGTALLVPLSSGRETLGALLLGSEGHDFEHDEWVDFTRAVGVHLGQALARARTAAELERANARYRILVESAHEGMFVLRASGEIVEVNRAGEQQLGRPAADIVGRPMSAFQRDDRGDPILVRPDGSELVADISASPVDIGGERLALAIVRDVTARRRAEQALAASEAKYRSLIENVPELVWHFDGQGRTQFVSATLERLFGWTREDLAGPEHSGWMARVHRDDRRQVRTAYEAMFAHGAKMDCEYRFRHKDGSWRWVHSRAEVVPGPDGPEIEGLTADVTERKLAELRLLESEAHYRAIFETSPEPTWIFDAEDHRFLSVNEAAVRVYGYTRDEFLAMTLRDIKLPEDVPQMLRHLATTTAATIRGSARHRRRDGSLIDVEAVASQIVVGGRAARLVIVQDVTARLQYERRLAAQHGVAQAVAAARTLAEAAPGIVAAVAESGGWTAGALWSRDGMCAGSWSASGAAHADDAARVARARAAGVPEWHDGGVAWPVRSGGETVAVLTLAGPGPADAAELLAALADRLAEPIGRLRSEEERDRLARDLRLLMDSTSEGICAVDRQNRCTFANPAAARMLGYTPEQLVGRNLHELIHHSRADGTPFPEAECPIYHAFATCQPLGRAEDVLWRSDGTSFDAICRAAPIVVGGEATGAVVTFLDATRERKLEQQLRHAQRMEAIGRLAGGVAHDFNNILAVILSYAALLGRELGAEDPRHADAEEIRRAAERGATLTRQLLAFSRQQMLEPKVIDLNDVVAGVEKMLRRVIGEDIELDIRLGAELGAVRADVGQIEQVLVNLAVNARDAMPHGGQLHIETSAVELDAGHVLDEAPTRPGPYLLLSVTDTGQGMTDEVRRRAFEPFFTTKERGHGTGLGLSTCYGIIRQSGGYIWLYSEPGRGVVFKIFLPVVHAALDPISCNQAPVSAGGAETILVIEDDDTVRAAVRRMLADSGYRVVEARDAAQARSVWSGGDGGIDLILSDVVTPGPSGPEIVAELRAGGDGARVLFMSGYSGHAMFHGGVLPAGTAFIQKPFSPEALARKVRETLDV